MEIEEKEMAYERARKKVKKIQRFYRSLVGALFTISIVAAVNYYVNEWAYPWFLWVVFGLGISLFFKGIDAFDWSIFSKEWEDRKIKELIDKEKK
ncbi:MAG: 2TM domain-containing protein [Flavobacteriaceae bacterium]|jgi:hypothetical protein|nr:2TM domain-containing protein [Flavobacteriaceae bacterium]MCI5088906.1 2TM domain-containing protein [Flavobacteriaceae bacterium]CAI8224376.1 MAG: Uncharacterised protein [SAR116 cluster bacterium]